MSRQHFNVQALQGRDITIYRDGSQAHGFCYLDDLIEGFIRMMNSEEEFTGLVNMGKLGEFTMLQLAENALRLARSSSKLFFLPLPEDDPRQPARYFAGAREVGVATAGIT